MMGFPPAMANFNQVANDNDAPFTKETLDQNDIDAFFKYVIKGNVDGMMVAITRFPTIVNTQMGECIVDNIDCQNLSPVHAAVMANKMASLDVLLEHRAITNIMTYDNSTPIYKAIDANNVEMIEKLVAHSARLDVLNMKDMSPLMHAVSLNYCPSVDCLLCLGANPFFENDKKQSALMLAKEFPSVEQLIRANMSTRYDKMIETAIITQEKTPLIPKIKLKKP